MSSPGTPDAGTARDVAASTGDPRERAHPDEAAVLARTRLRPWLPLLLSLVPAAATVVWAAVALPGMPEQVPVHWGPDGRPDAWEPTSLFALTQGVLITVPVMAVMTAMIPLLVSMTEAGSPAHSPWMRVRRIGVRRGMTAAMGMATLLTTLLVCGVTALLLLGQGRPNAEPTPWWLFPALVTALIVLLLPAMSWAMRRAQAWSAAAATELGYRPTPQEEAEDRLWTPLGMKNDPDDPLIIVNKREGYGTGATVNIGSRGGRALYRGFLAVFVVGTCALLWIVPLAGR